MKTLKQRIRSRRLHKEYCRRHPEAVIKRMEIWLSRETDNEKRKQAHIIEHRFKKRLKKLNGDYKKNQNEIKSVEL